MIVALCEVIENLCFFEPAAEVLKKVLYPVILCLNLLCLPTLWIFDPELHIKVSDIALATISTIIERFDQTATSIVWSLAHQLMTNPDVEEYISQQFELSKIALTETGVDIRMIKIKPHEISSKYLTSDKWRLIELGLTLLDRFKEDVVAYMTCLLYTSPSPRDS